MKETPFVFGRLATSSDYTDRDEEAQQLASNFSSLVNTVLVSPRRWGKTSLINRVTETLGKDSPEIRICNIDLFNVRTEEEFYISFATEVLRSTSSKWEEMVQNAREFLARLMPRISFSPDNQNEISFGIGWDELKKKPDEILDLAETIAVKSELRMVVCIDEFQSIADFRNATFLQKKLRSHWQRHTHVSYCLYGSKRHMLLEVFTNPSMPFYKFGDLMFLKKISQEKWKEFIRKRFSETGKSIRNDEATLIAGLAECHSYYVQQLAQQCWLRTKTRCSASIVLASHEGIINQLSLLFVNITESLSATQLNFLKAILSGENQLSSQNILLKYKLGTSANIGRLRQSLLAREIIDVDANQTDIQDPMYKHWLISRYFKLPVQNG